MIQTNMVSIQRYKPCLLVKGQNNVLTATFLSYTGDAQSISSGTVYVYNPSGTLISSGAATISSFTATYTVTSSELASSEYGINWKVRWSMDTVDITERAALVAMEFWCPITVSDVKSEEPVLYNIYHRDNGNEVKWDTFVHNSYKAFYTRLMTVQKFPWLVMSPDAFRSYLLYDVLARIYRSLGVADDAQGKQAQMYSKMAESEWSALRFDYDTSQDQIISTSENGKSGSSVIFLGGL